MSKNTLEVRVSQEASSFYNLAIKAFEEKNYLVALYILDDITKKDPQFKEAWCSKGIALGYLTRHEEGLSAFNKALELDPQFKEAWYNKGIALVYIGNYEGALYAFEEALSRKKC